MNGKPELSPPAETAFRGLATIGFAVGFAGGLSVMEGATAVIIGVIGGALGGGIAQWFAHQAATANSKRKHSGGEASPAVPVLPIDIAILDRALGKLACGAILGIVFGIAVRTTAPYFLPKREPDAKIDVSKVGSEVNSILSAKPKDVPFDNYLKAIEVVVAAKLGSGPPSADKSHSSSEQAHAPPPKRPDIPPVALQSGLSEIEKELLESLVNTQDAHEKEFSDDEKNTVSAIIDYLKAKRNMDTQVEAMEKLLKEHPNWAAEGTLQVYFEQWIESQTPK